MPQFTPGQLAKLDSESAREEIRDMERTYTQDFMAMDPKARALRARLAELEKSLKDPRQKVVVTKIIHHYYPSSVLNGTRPPATGTAQAFGRNIQQALGPGNPSNVNIKNMFARRNNWSDSQLTERLKEELAIGGKNRF